MPRPEARWLQVLLAASGAFRVAIGALWLKAYVRMNSGAESAAAMSRIWKSAQRLRIFFRGEEFYRNRFGRNWREKLLLRILQEMRRAGLSHEPRVRVSGLEFLLTNADEKIPTIVVTTHSPVDAVLNRIFRENGIPSSLLVDKAVRISKKAQLLGLQGELDTIARTNDALLIMRRKLNEGRLICACVDFTWPRARSFYVDVRISPAMFELAKSMKASILYAENWVSADGHIEVAFGTPTIDTKANTAQALSQDFIAWLQKSLGDQRDLRVLKWQRKERRRSGLLKLAGLTARPDR